MMHTFGAVRYRKTPAVRKGLIDADTSFSNCSFPMPNSLEHIEGEGAKLMKTLSLDFQ